VYERERPVTNQIKHLDCHLKKERERGVCVSVRERKRERDPLLSRSNISNTTWKRERARGVCECGRERDRERETRY